MSTLLMNTDQARSTASTIQQNHDNILSAIQTVNNTINALCPGEWKGASSDQFKAEFDAWHQKLNTALEELTTLKGRLDREIAEWEQMAANLSA